MQYDDVKEFLQKFYKKTFREVNGRLQGGIVNHDEPQNIAIDTAIKTMEDLAIYQKKIAEGLMVEMPCRVGDTVYCVGEISCKQCEYSKNQTFYEGLKDINGEPIVDDCEEDCPVTVKETKFEIWFIDDIGKEYFLTREEAEKAMEEREQE